MTQKIKVQNGNVVYSTPDGTDVNLTVEGDAHVHTVVRVGTDINASGQISTPDGSTADLVIKTETDGLASGSIKLEPALGGNILLNQAIWPTNFATPGMFLGVSDLNVLSYQLLVLGIVGSDTLTSGQLAIDYPDAIPGQIVAGPTVIYTCISSGTWRASASALGFTPVNKAGDTMLGSLVLNANPTSNLEAATKQYVDSIAQGIIAKPAVLAATTVNLTSTYNNGAAGVGATLTSTSNGAFPVVDDVTLTAVFQGILVKNQSNAAENGRYSLSVVGDAFTQWELTRCGYCDTADEIPSSYVFVQAGTVNIGTGWVALVDDPLSFTVGTDNINWVQFSGPNLNTGEITINTQPGDYMLQLSDAFNTLIRMTKATPTVLTIPNDTTANLPIGSAVLIGWNGLGQVSIAGEAGVTIDTPDSYNIGKQFGKITAIKTGANHWEIEGNLEPI